MKTMKIMILKKNAMNIVKLIKTHNNQIENNENIKNAYEKN